jgi:hypothetical protein
MHEAMVPSLEAWANFYVIVGSSAAALTGLQFVVLTLIAQAGATNRGGESVAAFGSPNVVHFCSALLVASILSMPWHTMLQAGIPVTACGVAGVVYGVVVFGRARRQRGYEPVFEDWVWHTVLPALAYAALLVSGAVLAGHPSGAMFVIGAAVLLLVFIGIHNAWDTVTYLMFQHAAAQERSAGAQPAAAPRTDAGAPQRPGAAAPAAGQRPPSPPSHTP